MATLETTLTAPEVRPSADKPVDPRPSRENSVFAGATANWLWYGTVVVAGFILPRFIDRHQGKELLGVWDFGFSLMFYVRWLKLGLSGAINRDVARFRAKQDWAELNYCVNTSLAMLFVMCSIGAIVAAGFAWAVPALLTKADPDLMATARWVVFVLGLATLMEMAGSALNSIVSGCGRFDILNLIRGVREVVVLSVMIGLLVGGFGLLSMAIVMLVSATIMNVVYAIAGRRLCPQLRYSPRLARLATLKTTLAFTTKSITQAIANGLLYQVNSILVGSFLGPAVLAIYSRQRSLVLHMANFIRQYSYVLTPKSSALDATNDHEQLRKLLMQSSRYGLYITLPIVLVLCIMGGPLLQVWMGKSYEAPLVLIVLAVGHLASTSQNSVYSVLVGMARHGRPAVISLVAAVAATAAAYVGLKLGGGLLFTAAIISVTVAVTDGIVVPIHACRQIGLSYATYLRNMLSGPPLVCVPFAVCLLVARLLFAHSAAQCLLIGLGAGGVVLGVIYWLWVIPKSARRSLTRRLERILPRRRSLALSPSRIEDPQR